MDTEEKYILDSYLITGEDFADFQVAARKMKTSRLELIGFRLLGMGLILESLLGRVYFYAPTGYNNIAYFLVTCLGIGICLYYDFAMPYIVRRRARRYFANHTKHMVASRTEFDGMGVRFVTDMGCERISYEEILRVYEDKRVILLDEGCGMRFLPKRVLTMDEYKGVRKFLKRALRENYLQEGVC